MCSNNCKACSSFCICTLALFPFTLHSWIWVQRCLRSRNLQQQQCTRLRSQLPLQHSPSLLRCYCSCNAQNVPSNALTQALDSTALLSSLGCCSFQQSTLSLPTLALPSALAQQLHLRSAKIYCVVELTYTLPLPRSAALVSCHPRAWLIRLLMRCSHGAPRSFDHRRLPMKEVRRRCCACVINNFVPEFF